VKLSADSLLAVINDILDFSKIEAGKIDFEMIDFDIRETMEMTMKTLAFRTDEKGLELLCDIAQEVPEAIQGDSTRLRQVVIKPGRQCHQVHRQRGGGPQIGCN